MRFRTDTESPLRLLARRSERALRCSFCGKSESEVKKLVVGPMVCICNECVTICNQVIAEAEVPKGPALIPK